MYHAPTDLSDALRIVAGKVDTVVAGGTDVFPSARQGRLPQSILDVTTVAGLNEITHGSEGTRIGAAATWSQIINTDLPPAFDALKEAAREVGSVQIQYAGTIAGNLCNASPAADGVPPLMALDASVELESQARGKRVLPLNEFLLGVRHTALADDELVTAVLIPPMSDKFGSAFEKLGSRRYLVISITMTAAVIALDARGTIAQARVSIGACSPVAQRMTMLEDLLIGQFPNDVVVRPEMLPSLLPIDDVRGTREFRLDVVAEQCARAIRRAAAHE